MPPTTMTSHSEFRCIPISRRLFNHGTANRFGDDFSIAIFAGEAARPVKIVRTENFHVPGVRFQFGRDVDFPKPRAVTDSRKNSRCHGLLKPLWDFISYNLYGHTKFDASRFPKKRLWLPVVKGFIAVYRLNVYGVFS